MSGHDWKVLAAFGLLLGGISIYDAGFAVKLGGVAIAVILVRNSGKIPLLSSQASPAASSRTPAPGSSTLHLV